MVVRVSPWVNVDCVAVIEQLVHHSSWFGHCFQLVVGTCIWPDPQQVMLNLHARMHAHPPQAHDGLIPGLRLAILVQLTNTHILRNALLPVACLCIQQRMEAYEFEAAYRAVCCSAGDMCGC